ncbi:glycosyltransferase family 69 protein [Mycena olivaceomarginata]|nr:glycosyltransferase family 69 protein [Mycena olivaceomarginata]
MNSKSRNTGVAGQLRRIPTPVALLIGILFGLLFSRLLPWTTSTASVAGLHYRGKVPPAEPTTHPASDPRAAAAHIPPPYIPLAALYQGMYTKYPTTLPKTGHGALCPLIGHKSPSRNSWLGGFGMGAASSRTTGRGPPAGMSSLLRIFDALTRSVGMRITIRTSTRTRGAFNHRIEYLAEVRNAAFVPLHELREGQNEFFDTIVFMNDILPCVDDLLELIWQSRTNNAGITCAADYMYHDEIGSPVFYDNWVARDINGTALENAPFESIFHHPHSNDRFQKHLPIQVQSCWNGIAILDPEPFYLPPHVKFRMAKIADNECSASECSLICNDYWNAGYGRIMMVPRVKLAYDRRVFDIIHPTRRNLTAIRGYVRMGGLPDDPRTDPQDRSWFGPHDRLFTEEESEPLEFAPGPEHVWCWGWDGAGDLEGPDVDPIWERMSNKSTSADAVVVKHVRSLLT